MTIGEKISQYRIEQNLTQEQLADLLHVTRQAVSKWESDRSYPETEHLLRMSDIFHCSLDDLLKDKSSTKEEQVHVHVTFPKLFEMEKKSEKTFHGLPLWHIGKSAKGIIAVGWKAKGVIAIGMHATGLLSFGMFSLGLFSFGLLSFGLLALGILAFGLFAGGCFAFGFFAFGAICFGVLSCGALAIGDFSFGALAIGKYLAVGDTAKALVAIGQTKASGSSFEKIGELTSQDFEQIKEILALQVPTYLSWIKQIALSLLMV